MWAGSQRAPVQTCDNTDWVPYVTSQADCLGVLEVDIKIIQGGSDWKPVEYTACSLASKLPILFLTLMWAITSKVNITICSVRPFGGSGMSMQGHQRSILLNT